MTISTLGTQGTYHERLNFTSATTVDLSVGAYILFGGIWTYAFLSALTLMTVAGCVFYFYFVNKKSVPGDAYLSQYDDNQTDFPVWTHMRWTLRYHIGTLALGSLIVAIVTFIQFCVSAVFAYLENNTPGGNNFVVRLVGSCIQCCLYCFKKTIEFINSYAYIYCFVENIGFCAGCVKTFSLMLRYPAQIAINTSVQAVLTTLLSVTTPLCCGLLAFLYFDFAAPDASSHSAAGGLLLPGVCVLVAFLMTRAFAAIWEQVIQSLTVCVLHDVDNFNGRFLRESMRDAFGDPKKAPDKTYPASDKAEPDLVST